MTRQTASSYPVDLPYYNPIFDQGEFGRRELNLDTKSWRSEKYAQQGKSEVHVLDHDGDGWIEEKKCNDQKLKTLLDAPKQPRLRVVVLRPTVEEKLAQTLLSKKSDAVDLVQKNELAALDPDASSEDSKKPFISSQFDISKEALINLLSHYEIAPAAISHIRGQEQVYGRRVSRDADGKPQALQFWYAMRARAFISQESAEADLKVTVVTRYNFKTDNTFVLLKYRSYNDLADILKRELSAKLIEFFTHPSTKQMCRNPFVVGILHMFPIIQYMRRAARGPRDIVVAESKKVHNPESLRKVDIRKLHVALAGLDKDIVQLQFLGALCSRLQREHQTLIDMKIDMKRDDSDPAPFDFLDVDVLSEMEKLQDFTSYFGEMIKDTRQQTQRVLDLTFSLTARWDADTQARMAVHTQNMNVGTQEMTKAAVLESKDMSRIATITMLFLPGTFITSVLGSNFFSGPRNDSADAIKVSMQIWVLALVIVVLTALVFLGFHFVARNGRRAAEENFHRLSKPKDDYELDPIRSHEVV